MEEPSKRHKQSREGGEELVVADRTLFVQNSPTDSNEQDCVDMFTPLSVVRVQLSKTAGGLYVEFRDRNTAAAALSTLENNKLINASSGKALVGSYSKFGNLSDKDRGVVVREDGIVSHVTAVHAPPTHFNQGPRETFGTTVFIAGLHPQQVTISRLYNLCSFYGNIRVIKILPVQKNYSDVTALVNYTEPEEARNAIQYLNGLLLFDMPLRVQTSPKNRVQVPPGAWGETEQDYDDPDKARLHRYPEGTRSARYKFVGAPTNALHVMIADKRQVDDSFIRSLFEPYGHIESLVRAKNPGMFFVNFSTVESAVKALACVHNSDALQGTLIRVTFTKPGITSH